MVRRGQLVVALALCGTAQAETVRASFAVSVTVVDQCIVRPDLRSATCTGGAGYAVGIAHERVSLPASGPSAAAGDQALQSGDGLRIASPSPAAGGRVGAAIADRAILAHADQIDALRITYSF